MSRVRIATLALCVLGVLGAVAPALATAGSISGTVTAAAGGAPIAGIRVCVSNANAEVETVCTLTDAAGAYMSPSLPVGVYRVRFSELGNRNFVDEYYDDKGEFGSADLVTVGAAEGKTGIDAALLTGGTIAGTITGPGGGAVAGLRVCAFATMVSGSALRCWRSDGAGDYAINGLPPGNSSSNSSPKTSSTTCRSSTTASPSARRRPKFRSPARTTPLSTWTPSCSAALKSPAS